MRESHCVSVSGPGVETCFVWYDCGLISGFDGMFFFVELAYLTFGLCLILFLFCLYFISFYRIVIYCLFRVVGLLYDRPGGARRSSSGGHHRDSITAPEPTGAPISNHLTPRRHRDHRSVPRLPRPNRPNITDGSPPSYKDCQRLFTYATRELKCRVGPLATRLHLRGVALFQAAWNLLPRRWGPPPRSPLQVCPPSTTILNQPPKRGNNENGTARRRKINFEAGETRESGESRRQREGGPGR